MNRPPPRTQKVSKTSHSPSSPALPRAQGRIPVRNGPWCREGSGVASGFALRLHRHFRIFFCSSLGSEHQCWKMFLRRRLVLNSRPGPDNNPDLQPWPLVFFLFGGHRIASMLNRGRGYVGKVGPASPVPLA